ncbi:hypothetical protein NEOLEDRAFT_920588 [Neolentinus lepideus HHB14362 ss-1]|uniref:Uncharacterized protein n=1 Tax=Neolentinus lepideus HHB14362 ss-1 TaxID=1314782 RepID=A0A165NNN6_9AGAM|nr:hypothetical protein NEOLEDRAFT_920588 [Neolentinus lepideus HHB14362 ss-1]
MTTWAYPVRHPWLDMSKLKRKEMEDDVVYTSPPSKRRRWDTLEHGFAGLTINNALQGRVQGPSFQTRTQPYASSSSLSTVSSSDGSYIQFHPAAPQASTLSLSSFTGPSSSPYPVQPTSIEEPVSPELMDVKMKGTSWYEPEKDRVVITDLDEFAEESEEEGEASRDNNSIEVASGYLAHLKLRDPFIRADLGLPTRQPETNMALVLFRPPPSFDTLEITELHDNNTNNATSNASSATDDTSTDETLMDYEPMDIEP